MSIKIKILKKIYKKCPECGNKIQERKNYKVLLNQTFHFLECKSCGWIKG